MDEQPDEARFESDEVVYCPRHPKVEALLRCYQCGAPICPKCAQRTPVGYICPDCLRGRKQKFEQAEMRDLVLGGAVSLVLSFVASLVLILSGCVVIFLSPLVGLGCAEAAWRAARRHYSLRLPWVVVGAMVLGVFLAILVDLGLSFGIAWASVSHSYETYGVFGLLGFGLRWLWALVHIVLMAVSAWWRLK